jgi:hypothetical protein
MALNEYCVSDMDRSSNSMMLETMTGMLVGRDVSLVAGRPTTISKGINAIARTSPFGVQSACKNSANSLSCTFKRMR